MMLFLKKSCAPIMATRMGSVDHARGSPYTGVRRAELASQSRCLKENEMLRSVLIAAVAMGALLGGGTAYGQGKVEVKVVNSGRVYHPRNLASGQSYKVSKPALCDSKQVFDATPEYQKIKDDKIKKGSAQHRILIQAASNRFKNAVQKVMSQKGHGLVAETGAIVCEGHSLPDITQALIANL